MPKSKLSARETVAANGLYVNGGHAPQAMRALLDAARRETGLSMADLTVLVEDPARMDTPAWHRDSAWLRAEVERLDLADRTIHMRGVHYALLGRTKPDGSTYISTEKDEDYEWLSEVGKAARWLGYIGFDQIHDERNSEPLRREGGMPPEAKVTAGVTIEIPDVEDLEPKVITRHFAGVQPYRLVLIGEKSSLEPVLRPIADQYDTDLYLPTGEMSDTLIYRMAVDAINDGRPLRPLYFADCDPAGWQMPISVAHKLRLLRERLFPELDFAMHRVALTPDQTRLLGLPSNPLKAKDPRALRWHAEMGVAQVEIDALAQLQPDVLDQLARDAINQFFDLTLDRRVKAYRDEWRQRAQAVVDSNIDADHREQLRAAAAVKLAEVADVVAELDEAFAFDVEGLELPPIVLPTHQLDEGACPPGIVDTEMTYAQHALVLRDQKAYRRLT